MPKPKNHDMMKYLKQYINSVLKKVSAKYVLQCIIILLIFTLIHEPLHVLGAKIMGYDTQININYLFNANTTLISGNEKSLVQGIPFHIMPYFVMLFVLGAILIIRKRKSFDKYKFMTSCFLVFNALHAFVEFFQYNDLGRAMGRSSNSILLKFVVFLIFEINLLASISILFWINMKKKSSSELFK